jgi:ATP-binding cassette subfamily B protein/ATP-binding cassette subfamily C protein
MRRWWAKIPRQGQPKRAAGAAAADLPELEDAAWYVHAAEAESASFWRMAKKLPALAAEAIALAWAANRWLTVLALGLNLAAGVLTTTALLGVADVTATLFAAEPTMERIVASLPAVIVVAAATAGRSVLGLAAGWAQQRLAPLVQNAIEARFFELSTQVPRAAWDEDAYQDVIEQCRQRGVRAVVDLVEDTVDLVTALVTVTAVGVALVVLNPILLVLLFLAAVPTGWAAVRSARLQYASNRSRVSRRRRMWVYEMLMASEYTADEVRVMELGPWLRAQYAIMVAVETAADFAVIRQQTWTRLAGSTASGIALGGVYAALLGMIGTGTVPLAAAAAAVVALQSGGAAMRALMVAINTTYEDSLYAEAVKEFERATRERIDAEPHRHVPVPVTGPLPSPERISVERVSFTYPGADVPSLEGVSLEIARGQTVALVGENGSGKTTLAKLLSGLYAPTSGRILWDGQNLALVDPALWRGHVSVIGQIIYHWPLGAGTNIRIGRPDANAEKDAIVLAAQTAGAHDMIMKLDHGYDTLLSKMFKGGTMLSGGQWQRISAARGLFRDPDANGVLICDEPSAALDALAEAHLFSALQDRAGQGITILISHRLSGVRHADLIVVLEEGRIIESGNHDQLMAAGGRYASMFDLQASSYRP